MEVRRVTLPSLRKTCMRTIEPPTMLSVDSVKRLGCRSRSLR